MPIDTLYMGDTSPGEYLKRGTGADSDKIVSGTVSGGSGGGSSPTDSISNVATTADVTVNSDNTVTVVSTGLELVGTSVPLKLNDELAVEHSITVDSTPQLLLDGTPIGGSSNLEANPTAVHGAQRLKDGVHQVYIEDEWVDQITGEFWNRDRTMHMSIFPRDISDYLTSDFLEAVDGTHFAQGGTPTGSFYNSASAFEFYIMLKYPMRIQELRLRTNGTNNSPAGLVNIEASNDFETWDIIREDIVDFCDSGDDQISFGAHVYKTYETKDDGTLYRFVRAITYNAGGLAAHVYDVSLKAIGRPTGAKPATFNIYPKTYTVTVPNMGIFSAVNNDTSKIYSGHGLTSGLSWAIGQIITAADYINIQIDSAADISQVLYMQSNSNTHGTWKVQHYDGSSFVDSSSSFLLGGARYQIIPLSSSINTSQVRLVPITGPGNNTGLSSDIHCIAFDEKNKTLPAYVGGDRSASWIIAGTIGLQTGTFSDIIDGDTNDDTYFTTGGSAVVGEIISVEIPTASAMIRLKWEQDNASAHGVWDIESSVDGTTWVTRASSITLGGSTSTEYLLTSDITPYKHFRLVGVSGNTSSSPYLYNIDIELV